MNMRAFVTGLSYHMNRISSDHQSFFLTPTLLTAEQISPHGKTTTTKVCLNDSDEELMPQ
jgi:hypothetical protein